MKETGIRAETVDLKNVKNTKETRESRELKEEKRSTWYEVYEHNKEGYQPLVDYGAWRVAALSYCDELLADAICAMQRHNETDEVFVLLRGRCLLFLGGDGARVEEIIPLEMEPFKVYNVKRSVWHTHTLSQGALVLVVENQDTTSINSPVCSLNQNQRQFLVAVTRDCWPDVIPGLV